MAETGTSLAEAIEWLEMPIDGLVGRTLGRVASIHLDAEDGEPRWLRIRRLRRQIAATSGRPT
jgi:hypothetical protein